MINYRHIQRPHTGKSAENIFDYTLPADYVLETGLMTAQISLDDINNTIIATLTFVGKPPADSFVDGNGTVKISSYKLKFETKSDNTLAAALNFTDNDFNNVIDHIMSDTTLTVNVAEI